ncbi:hypothetical protein [Corallibacter sp.]|uniref:DUF6712 family protein n=1 Tax=Corallibacter sp. TaxID=2038084 RepID=UPI003AB3E018
MNQLLTVEEFKSLRNISKKVDTDKINECISLAQNIDLMDVLGDFYFELVENYEDASYEDLMSGSTFNYNSKTYIHQGIKSYLADLTYTRFVYIINTHFTPFGLQQKFTEDSNPVDRNFIKDLVKQTQADSDVKFKFIDLYIKSQPNLFPNYKTGNDDSITTFSQKFYVKK